VTASRRARPIGSIETTMLGVMPWSRCQSAEMICAAVGKSGRLVDAFG
jgi:hypothetical protein